MYFILIVYPHQQHSGDTEMTTYETKENAVEAAIAEHGALSVEMEVVVVKFIGPMIARHMGCKEGWTYE